MTTIRPRERPDEVVVLAGPAYPTPITGALLLER